MNRKPDASPATTSARKQVTQQKASVAEPASADGTQAIRRASALLKEVAKTGAQGAPLGRIAAAVGLPPSTAHRILRCLLDDGLLELSDKRKHYQIGPLIYELGLTSTSSATESARWRPLVEAVARRTGVTAYLMRRSGVEAVCLIKADGHSIFRFVPVEVGQRRLLGVGAGATALLAAMPAESAEHVIDTIGPSLSSFPRIDVDSLRQAVRRVRRTGFAISQGTAVIDGYGLGATLTEAPHLAISIAAHAMQATESSVKQWKAVIMEEMAAAVHSQRRSDLPPSGV